MTEDEVGMFWRDLRRFGGPRALIREDHRTRRREFIMRQKTLAILGFGMLGLFLLSGMIFAGVIAAVVFTTGRDECLRMRAVGRYHQTGRSVEVLGL